MPGSPLTEWLKPDSAKAVVILNKIQWQGYPVDVAVPVGKRIPPRTLKWLMDFAQQHGRPLLYGEQILIGGVMQEQQNFVGYGPPAFQDWIRERKEKGLPLWVK